MAEKKSTSTTLAEAFLARKFLTEQQFAKAQKIHQENGKTILEAVSEIGIVASDDLLAFAASELNVPFIRLSRFSLTPQVLTIIPKKIAYEKQVVAVSKIRDVLIVAMVDPTNHATQELVRQAVNLNVVPVLASAKEILEVLDTQYTQDTAERMKDVFRDLDVNMTIIEEKKEAANLGELLNLTQEMPVVKLTDHILNEGVRRRASDIFIEPQEKELVVRYRIDGVLHEGPRPPRIMHRGIVSRIKVMTNLDIAEHRLPQDGRLKLKMQSRMGDFRISTIPTYFGEKVCLRILDPSQANLQVKTLGFDEKSLDSLLRASSQPYGMILTCGPTGSGKTTTLYAVLNHLNSISRNIVTIEDPVEYAVDGINQVNARPDVGLTFAAALRSILRQDPNVVLVGEIRDQETAEIAVKAALTGHLVLSTLHTNTAVGCIVRLSNMGLEPFLLASSIVLAASQRLMRKLCNECKEEVAIAAPLKKHLGLKENDAAPIFRAKGCDRCMHTGYHGRTSIMEALTMTPKIRELIMKKSSESLIKALARKEGMVTLRENGILKMKQGITSPEEVLRVTMADEEASK